MRFGIAKGSSLFIIALAFLAIPASVVLPSPQTSASSFLETFDGEPLAPQSWRSPSMDVTVYRRHRNSDGWYALEALQADHGADCSAPPASHLISSYEGAFFQCRNHAMSAIVAGGRGAVYLTPSHLVDFSNGEAVVRFDMSTLRNSGRDWIELHLTPFHQNVQLPAAGARRGVRIVMSPHRLNTYFQGYVIDNAEEVKISRTGDTPNYEQVLVPSATRRETFELRISRNHVKFGMPAYNIWWVDGPIPDLGWEHAMFQVGHYSYNPEKDCDTCGPTTWHWDNFAITPSLPATMLQADRRFADKTVPGPVNFSAPAPEDAYLRFTAMGDNLEVSYDGGNSWQTPRMQFTSISQDDFNNYWTPIPSGTQQVLFRGSSWHVRDISLWAVDPEVVPGAFTNNVFLPTLRR